MSDSTESKSDQLIYGLISLLCFPFSVFFWAVVTREVWNWFAPVLSPSAPTLSLSQAIALRALIGLLTWHLAKVNMKESAKATAIRVMAGSFVAPWVALLFSYLLHLFVHA